MVEARRAGAPPRRLMHMCVASITTATPRGSRARSSQSATSAVSRSWTWRRRAVADQARQLREPGRCARRAGRRRERPRRRAADGARTVTRRRCPTRPPARRTRRRWGRWSARRARRAGAPRRPRRPARRLVAGPGAAVDAEGVKGFRDRALGALAVHARRGSSSCSAPGRLPFSTITWAPVVLERSSLVGRTA